MARQRRDQALVLSFDGLTDVVTNLAGTLILLVVLILGVTRAAQRGGSPPSAPPEGNRRLENLLREVQALEMQTRLIDRQIQQMEEDLPELEKRANELRQKWRSAPSHEHPPERRGRTARALHQDSQALPFAQSPPSFPSDQT